MCNQIFTITENTLLHFKCYVYTGAIGRGAGYTCNPICLCMFQYHGESRIHMLAHKITHMVNTRHYSITYKIIVCSLAPVTIAMPV